MAFAPSDILDDIIVSGSTCDLNRITELLLIFDDSSIESKLTKLGSDLFNGLQNRSFILYLKQFDNKKQLKVFKNIIFKCFYLVNGDFNKCQQMINQIGKEIIVQPEIQPKEKPTNKFINDNEKDMGSVFNSDYKSIERNLEIIFGFNSSKNGSLEIENLSDFNGLSKHDNNLSKSNNSNCEGQSSKKKSCHNKKSSNKLQKIDINTENNGNNVTSLKHEKIAQPKNYTSPEETLIPTVNSIHLNISDNEQSALSKKLVHTPKRIKIAEPKNDTNEETLIPTTNTLNLTISDNKHNDILGKSNEINNKQSILKKKSVHTYKRIKIAEPRNGSNEETSSDEETLIPATDTLNLIISDNKHNGTLGMSNGINSKQSALSKKSVHTHKRKKKSQSRNDFSIEETLTPMTDTLNLTISDSKRNDVLGKSNEINNEQLSLRKKSVHTYKRIKLVEPRSDTDEETLIPTTDTSNLAISDIKYNDILRMSNGINSEQSALSKKSVHTRVHTHKKKKKKRHDVLEKINKINIEQSILSKKSVHIPIKIKIAEPRNDISNKETHIPSTNTNLTISNNKHDILGVRNEINNEQSALNKKSIHTHNRKKAQPRNYTSNEETLIHTTDTANLTISDNKHNDMLGISNEISNEQSALNEKSVLTPKNVQLLQSRNDTSHMETLIPSTNVVDLTISDNEHDEINKSSNKIKNEESAMSKKTVHSPKRIKNAQSKNASNEIILTPTAITDFVDLTISDNEHDEIINEQSRLSEKSVLACKNIQLTQFENDTLHEETPIPSTNKEGLTIPDNIHDEINKRSNDLRNEESALSKKSVYSHSSEEESNDTLSINSVSNLIQSLWLANKKDTIENIMHKYKIFKIIVYEHFEICDSKIIDGMSNLLRRNGQHLKFDKMWLTLKKIQFKQLFDSLIKILNKIKFKRIVFIGCLVILFRNVVNTTELTSNCASYCNFVKFANVIRKSKNEDFWTSWLKNGWDDCFFGGCVIIDNILYNNTSCKLIHPAVNWYIMPSFHILFYTNYHNQQICSDTQNEHNTDNDQLELFSNYVSADFSISEINSIKRNEVKRSDVLPCTSSTVNVLDDSINVPVQRAKKMTSSHLIIQQLYAQAPKYSKKVETKNVASTIYQ